MLTLRIVILIVHMHLFSVFPIQGLAIEDAQLNFLQPVGKTQSPSFFNITWVNGTDINMLVNYGDNTEVHTVSWKVRVI